jgi:UDP-N-acetylmuramate--alanine ligase
MNSNAVPAVSLRTSAPATPDLLRDARVHMVGIGGCGMSGLASMLLRLGIPVSGSDARTSITIARLMSEGARISTHEQPDALPANTTLVVASAAIPADHAELHEAQRRGLPVLKYAQMLGALMTRYQGVAVSGTHGKSTTTAWLAFVLREAGLDPNFVVGGTVPQLGGGSGVGDGPHFVAEACEFDRSFLNLRARFAVILNIEEDHLDCYPDIAAIEGAFGDFAAGLSPDGLLLVNADDPRCRKVAARSAATVRSFGLGESADWRAADLALMNGTYAYTLVHGGQPLGRIRLSVSGMHNVMNSLAVIALANACGVPTPAILAAVPQFHGVKRRLDLRGEADGIRVVDDYAHHPTEIRATLAAARERFRPRRLWCIFQPHQHSRTRFLLGDFARSFELADHVVLPDIYFVRDTPQDRDAVSAADLAGRIREGGGKAEYIADFDAIVEALAGQVSAGDLVMTMGAGNIWKLADALVRRLGGHLPD